jgi:hypothetical protein
MAKHRMQRLRRSQDGASVIRSTRCDSLPSGNHAEASCRSHRRWTEAPLRGLRMTDSHFVVLHPFLVSTLTEHLADGWINDLKLKSSCHPFFLKVPSKILEIF